MPKITVLINCLNGENYVREAIESVYAQTYTDWEIVFWDNASTDSTPDIAKSYDERLRYFRSPETVPLGHARQWALEKARGEWLTILDHDDAFLPQRFERQMAALEGGDFALSYCGYNEIDESGKVLRSVLPRNQSGKLFEQLLANYEINVATVLMRRDLLVQIPLDTIQNFKMAEEYYLYLSLAARGPVAVVPEVLVNYRQVAASWTSRVMDRHAVEVNEALDQLQRDLPGIEAHYAEGFFRARAHADYIHAKYLMHAGQYRDARSLMASIRHLRKAYVMLWLASYVPPVWAMIHRRDIKARLTAMLMR